MMIVKINLGFKGQEMKVYKKRGCTIILNNKVDAFQTLLQEQNIYKNCCQDIFNLTKNLMVKGEILNRTFGSFCDLCLIKDNQLYNKLREFVVEKTEKDYKTGTLTTLYTITSANLVKTLYKDIFKTHGFVNDGISNYKRSIVKHTIDRIEGYLTRNKKNKKVKNGKIPTVSFKGRDIHIGEGLNYSADDMMLTLPYSKGKLEIPVYRYISKGMVSKNFGGNFMFKYDKKGNIYAVVLKAAVDLYEDASYTPKGFIGFDINQEAKYWISFDDGTSVARPDSMTNLITENKELNKLISNDDKKARIVASDGTIYEKGIGTKLRRKCRLRQDEVMHGIKKSTKNYARDLVNRAIQEGKGVAIDKITPGASNGEFGQYISEYIITLCEDLCVPFYVCPSAYSSRKCVCGNIDKKNRNKDEFKCVSCGYTMNSHTHAAQNMSRAATELFNLKCIFGNVKAHNVEKAAEKLMAIQEKMEKKNLTKEEIVV